VQAGVSLGWQRVRKGFRWKTSRELNMDRCDDLVALAVALHTAALVICNLTPSPKDDEALDGAGRFAVKLYRALEILAGIVLPLAKR